jgi:hypothetical protein
MITELHTYRIGCDWQHESCLGQVVVREKTSWRL